MGERLNFSHGPYPSAWIVYAQTKRSCRPSLRRCIEFAENHLGLLTNLHGIPLGSLFSLCQSVSNPPGDVRVLRLEGSRGRGPSGSIRREGSVSWTMTVCPRTVWPTGFVREEWERATPSSPMSRAQNLDSRISQSSIMGVPLIVSSVRTGPIEKRFL